MRFLFWIVVFSADLLHAQVRMYVPFNEHVKPTQTLFLAGSFNGWNPGDSNFRFMATPTGYELTLNNGLTSKGIECKITQGTWQTAEGSDIGRAIENRMIPPSKDTIWVLKVDGWEQLPAIKHTVSNRVVGHTIPYNGQPRKVWVYIPDGYEAHPSQQYPVLYLLDGQNLFDAATSFAGEWGVDEILDSISERRGNPSIVVAVEHGHENRLTEYTPFYNPKYGGGDGDAFARYLVYYVKSYIDSVYRTSRGSENTGVGGSSLGALEAAYTGIRYPHIFGKLLLFSPSFWWSDSLYTLPFLSSALTHQKWCIRAGIHESMQMQSDIERFQSHLVSQGVALQNRWIQLDTNGQHSERYWKQWFKAAYCWLYTGSCRLDDEVKVDASKHQFTPMATAIQTILLIGNKGETVERWQQPKVGEVLLFPAILKGNYLLRLGYENGTVSDVPVNLP